MKLPIKLFLHLLFFNQCLNAQTDLLEAIDYQDSSQGVSAAFKSLKVVNFESTKLVSAKELSFSVSHRFGSIKYGFDNTNVIVRIEQEKNNEIKVSVINSGEGIPDKYVDRLTERFFRVDKARSRKIGGTGLGLAIVKHILIKHRAQLSINSIPNQETNFSITFPVIN